MSPTVTRPFRSPRTVDPVSAESGTSPSSVEIRCVGPSPLAASIFSQNAAISVSSRPLPGIGVGSTTSNALSRSLATITMASVPPGPAPGRV